MATKIIEFCTCCTHKNCTFTKVFLKHFWPNWEQAVDCMYVRTMRKRVMRQRHWTIKRKYLSVGRKPNMNYARRSDTHFQKVHDHKFIISCDQFWMQYFQCNVNSMYFSRVIFTSVQISVKFGYLLLSSLFSTEHRLPCSVSLRFTKKAYRLTHIFVSSLEV